MLTKETLDLQRIKTITEAAALSGGEAPVTRLMKQALEDCVDSFDYDNLGSLIGYKQGSGAGPKVMLSAHADEIGFLVTKIDANGFVRVTTLSHWWTYTIIGQEVFINTASGRQVPGIFGTHFPGEDNQPPRYRNLDELYVDTGLRSREALLALGVAPGDPVSMRVEFREMADPDVMAAKAWDDRVGINILIDVMKELRGASHAADVYACGTGQEEVGYRGGKTCAYRVHPDIAITVDVAKCDDYPGCDPDGHKLAGGVVIRHVDSKVLGNQALSRFIQQAAADLGYPVEIIIQNYGGGEAFEIHRLFDGIITICLSIPTLYVLTPRAFVHKDRYVATVNTLVEVIKRLTNADLVHFKESLR